MPGKSNHFECDARLASLSYDSATSHHSMDPVWAKAVLNDQHLYPNADILCSKVYGGFSQASNVSRKSPVSRIPPGSAIIAADSCSIVSKRHITRERTICLSIKEYHESYVVDLPPQIDY